MGLLVDWAWLRNKPQNQRIYQQITKKPEKNKENKIQENIQGLWVDYMIVQSKHNGNTKREEIERNKRNILKK